jgi:ParB family chromosome partitioning protein
MMLPPVGRGGWAGWRGHLSFGVWLGVLSGAVSLRRAVVPATGRLVPGGHRSFADPRPGCGAGCAGALEHVAEQIRQQQGEVAEHERVRAELETSGCPVTDEMVPGSSLLTSLAHDGQDLTADRHKDCPGHGAFFRSHDRRTPVFFCTDPAAHGHTSRWAQPSPLTALPGAAAPDREQQVGSQRPGSTAMSPAASPVPEPAPDPVLEQARWLVIEGNRAWAAAAEVRKRWVAQLLWRRTAPKDALRFAAEQLLTMPEALRRGLPNAAGRMVFTELTRK